MPLELAVERSHCHDGVDIPVVVRDCIDYVQEHGMWTVINLCICFLSILWFLYTFIILCPFSTGLYMEGIYKVSGIKSKVQHLRRLYNLREAVQLSDFELPVVTSLLKQFLRLPSLIAFKLLCSYHIRLFSCPLNTEQFQLRDSYQNICCNKVTHGLLNYYLQEKVWSVNFKSLIGS